MSKKNRDKRDQDEYDKFLRRAAHEMFPKMRDSSFVLAIFTNPDPKLVIEIGAAVVFDKPLIIFAPEGTKIPVNLKRVASRIIIGDIKSEKIMKELEAAINSLKEDDRYKRPAQ